MSISDMITLLTGIAMFLFGMSLMGDGLKSLSGSRLEPILFRLSGTKLRGLVLGAGVTAVIQSSSATSVMMVGFVNAGMMKFHQAIPIILGAILGTSITGWVVCLSELGAAGGGIANLLSTATLTGVVAVTGIILRMFGKKQSRRHLGDIMMGFSVLMLGMGTMSGAVRGLGDAPWFLSLLTSLNHPLIGIGIGLLFSAVLQSASAAVGILQALSMTGAMTFSNSFPLLMGITIGASVPVLLSALGAKRDGKRTAVTYLAASILGVMICASLFYIAEAIFHFPWLDAKMDSVSIAAVNTVFRLFIVLLLAPLTDVLEALSTLLVPGGQEEEVPNLILEERFLAHPALAIAQCQQTICSMAQQAEQAMDAAGMVNNYSEKRYDQVEALEKAGDQYEDKLGSYLVRLARQELTEQQGRLASVYLRLLTDFERITDRALGIAKSARELEEKQIHFSGDALAELTLLHNAVQDNVHTTMSSFIQEDRVAASQVEPLEQVIDELCDELKRRHVERLQMNNCTIAQGFIFNDLLTNYRRVSDHCSNIAVSVIELDQGSFDSHEYLERMKEDRDHYFRRTYERFKKQYALPPSTLTRPEHAAE